MANKKQRCGKLNRGEVLFLALFKIIKMNFMRKASDVDDDDEEEEEKTGRNVNWWEHYHHPNSHYFDIISRRERGKNMKNISEKKNIIYYLCLWGISFIFMSKIFFLSPAIYSVVKWRELKRFHQYESDDEMSSYSNNNKWWWSDIQ